MRPELAEASLNQLKSQAEARVYKAFASQLDDKYLVLYSVPWLREGGRVPQEVESDFVIVHPDHGILVVEVKGGGILHDPVMGKWASIDRDGRYHEIKNPFEQATTGKHELIKELRELPKFPKLRICLGHAVLFPDITSKREFQGRAFRPELLGTRHDVENITRWVDEIYSYWSGRDGACSSLGKIGMEVVKRHFSERTLVRPLLSITLQDEEAERIQLTQQQSRLLRALQTHKRASISGAAGTGKTLLALQRARELAADGGRTLFICFNRPLADFLSSRRML